MAKEFIFKINGYTPDTLPMKRLAEYMADLAKLMGEPTAVHFLRLDKGSAKLVHKVDHEAIQRVGARIAGVASGNGPDDAMAAEASLNKKLREDNTDGELIDGETGSNVIPFPGVNRKLAPIFGPFSQPGILDGVVARVGGKDETIPVMLQTRDGYEARCTANRAVAKQLAKHLFDGEVRCTGIGKWFRDEEGVWKLEKFTITDFEPLDNRALTEVVAELRTIEGAEWKGKADIWKEVDDLRDDELE